MPGHRNSRCFSSAIRFGQISWHALCLGALLCAALYGVAQDGGQATSQPTPQVSPAAKTATSQQAAKPSAGNDRKKQIAEESNQLLTMALALKAEVDKTTKDTLSMNVIRKANEIEKLAHTVKEKVKQGPG